MEVAIGLKTKISSIISSFLSVLGISGSGAQAVCQTTCSAGSSILPLIGISLSATPFAFLEEYQLVIWWVAAAFFSVLLYLYLIHKIHTKLDLSLLWVNGGLLTIGFPYFRNTQILQVFLWGGLGLVIVGLWLMLTYKKIVIQFGE